MSERWLTLGRECVPVGDVDDPEDYRECRMSFTYKKIVSMGFERFMSVQIAYTKGKICAAIKIHDTGES